MLLRIINQTVLDEAQNGMHCHIDIVECAACNRVTQVRCVDLVVVLVIVVYELVDPR